MPLRTDFVIVEAFISIPVLVRAPAVRTSVLDSGPAIDWAWCATRRGRWQPNHRTIVRFNVGQSATRAVGRRTGLARGVRPSPVLPAEPQPRRWPGLLDHLTKRHRADHEVRGVLVARVRAPGFRDRLRGVHEAVSPLRPGARTRRTRGLHGPRRGRLPDVVRRRHHAGRLERVLEPRQPPQHPVRWRTSASISPTTRLATSDRRASRPC